MFATELVAKRLQLLRELLPATSLLAVLVDPSSPTVVQTTLRDLKPAAHAMGMEIRVLNASTAARRSTQPSQLSSASGPTRFSSTPGRCSPPGECNSPSRRHVT